MPFIRTSKGVHGPFSAEHLKALHRQGKLPADAEYGNTADGPWRKVPALKKQAGQGEGSPPQAKASRESSGWLAVALTLVCCLAICAITAFFAFPALLQPRTAPSDAALADADLPGSKAEEAKPSEKETRADANAAKGEPGAVAAGNSADSQNLAFLMPDRHCVMGSAQDIKAVQCLQTFLARKEQLSRLAPWSMHIHDVDIPPLANLIWQTVRQQQCSFYKDRWVMLSGEEVLSEARAAGLEVPDTISSPSELGHARQVLEWLKATNTTQPQPRSNADYAKAFGKYMTAGRRFGLLEDCGAMGVAEIIAHLLSYYGPDCENFVRVERKAAKVTGQIYEERWLDLPALAKSPQALENLLAYSLRKIGAADLRLLCVGDESRHSSETVGTIRAILNGYRQSQYEFCLSHEIKHPFESLAAVYVNSGKEIFYELKYSTPPPAERVPLQDWKVACIGVSGRPTPLGYSEYPEKTLDIVAADYLIIPLNLRHCMAEAVTAAMERIGKKWMRQGVADWETELPIHLKQVSDLTDFLVTRDSLLLHPLWQKSEESTELKISRDAIQPLVNAIHASCEKHRSEDPYTRLPKYTDEQAIDAFIATLSTHCRRVPVIYTVEGWKQWCSLIDKYRMATEAFRVIGVGKALGSKCVIEDAIKPEGEFVINALSYDTREPITVSLQEGDRVLLEGQGGCNNGTWIVAKGPWTRLLDEADPLLIAPEAIYDPTRLLGEQPTLYGWAYRSVVATGNYSYDNDLICAQFLHAQSK